MKTERQDKNTFVQKEYFRFIYEAPAAFLAAAWPCMTHAVKMPTRMEIYPWYPDVPEAYDFFMLIRSRLLVICAAAMACLLLLRFLVYGSRGTGNGDCRGTVLNTGGEKRQGCHIVLLCGVFIYLLLSLISSLTGINADMALRGQIESGETWYAVASCFVIITYTAVFSKTGDLRHAGTYILAGAFLQCVIGSTQLLGADFWSSSFGRWLLLGGSADARGLLFMSEETGRRQVYMTFYHSNYAAVYILLTLPVCVHVFLTAKTGIGKIFSGITVLFLVINLAGTGSMTALVIGGAAAAVFLVYEAGRWYERKTGRRGWRRIVVPGCLLIGILFLLISQKLLFSGKQTYMLRDVRTDTDGVHILYGTESREYILSASRTDDGLFFVIQDSKDGSVLTLRTAEKEEWMQSDTWLETADHSLEGLFFWVAGNDELCRIIMRQGDVNWVFEKYAGDGTYHYINIFGKEDVPVKAPSAFGEGYESALSERIYIWSRTVPLLRKHLLLGCGMENFVFEFPHNDYVMRANLQQLRPGAAAQITTRPHSMYLQIMMQSGIAAFLFLTASGIALLILCVRACMKGSKHIGYLLASAVLFLLMGTMNDSVVVVTPVFAVILGMLVSAVY